MMHGISGFLVNTGLDLLGLFYAWLLDEAAGVFVERVCDISTTSIYIPTTARPYQHSITAKQRHNQLTAD